MAATNASTTDSPAIPAKASNLAVPANACNLAASMNKDERATPSPKPRCAIRPVASLGGELRCYRGILQPFVAHSHSHYVLGIVRKGERTLICNGRDYRIAPGTVIALNPNDVHSCEQLHAEALVYDSVTIAPEILGGATLSGPISTDATVGTLLGDAIAALREGAASESEAEESILLAAHLLEARPDPTAHPKNPVHEAACRRVFAYLRTHPSETPSLDELAAHEGMPKHTLIRAYRQLFSITPLQHHKSLRIERACGLPAEGCSPADVAAELGFADQAHLTRAFKQRLGITPARYRAMASASAK